MAYKLQKECENIEHVIYEKSSDIGGVWLQNKSVGKSLPVSIVFQLEKLTVMQRYPGCACDIPSHAYVRLEALRDF